MPVVKDVDARISPLLSDLGADLRTWRRHVHQHPELSFDEHRTAEYIESVLASFGVKTERPTATSVVATLQGRDPGRTVALRADIDALPIQEETGLAFASAVPGVMHACGHDGHVAALLGVAKVLAAVSGELSGSYRLVFQHAEEQTPKGAPELITAGALDGVDVIIGQHLVPTERTGTVCVNRGALLASADAFSITFTGRGGHGGLPHESADPIPATADFVHAVHRLAAREFAPQDPVVVSVTQVHAGEAYNIIPSAAVVGGTIRALSSSVRTRLATRVTELAQGIAALHGLTVDVRHEFGPPPVVNTPEVADQVAEVARKIAGVRQVTDIEPVMGGDDYAYYLERVPGVYVLIGANPTDEASAPYPPHHPRFDFAEAALPIATEVLLRSALALAQADSREPLLTPSSS
ncbi:M20 metallopeptidase family protein [Amycolatopsis sulphurea]|nr:M20 family metallopeptidase [Amycolatopsis sulphurea]